MDKLYLEVRRGTTVTTPIRVESQDLSYVQITGMSNSAPLRVTSPSHGLPSVWRAAVMNAVGMVELNTDYFEGVEDGDLRRITVVDSDHVDFPGVNSCSFSPYISGGQLVFYTPKDLSSYVSARMDVKDRVGGAVLATFNTATGGLIIDNSNKTLWLNVSLSNFSSVKPGDKVFDIEMVKASGGVDALCSADSVFRLLPEVTTSS